MDHENLEVSESNTRLLSNNETKNFDKEEHKSRWNFTAKDIKWSKVAAVTIIHVIGIYGYLTFPYVERYKTVLYGYYLVIVCGFGVTAGVHRYWTHKSYSATLPMRIVLSFCYLLAFQMEIIKWVSYHRVHHKFSETDADPHNSKRGFFFAHIGWFMIKKHPDVLKKLKQIDVSDIKADPVAVFVDKYFFPLSMLAQLISVAVPVFLWNELWYYSAMAQIMRYLYVVHSTSSINSLAHLWGTRPFNKHIAPTANKVAVLLTHGEGWHNYHHAFPNDCRCPEYLGFRYDLTFYVLKCYESIGWAYDLKQSPESLVTKTARLKGDGSFKWWTS